MEKILKEWLFDPTISKILIVLPGLMIIRVLVLQGAFIPRIEETQARYRV